MDIKLIRLFGSVIGLLVVASAIGFYITRKWRQPERAAFVENYVARINAWWVMVFLFMLAVLSGRIGAVCFFGVTSFLAFREFITLTPTRRSDHRTLFWAFFVIIPVQYFLVAIEWYGLFTLLIPVYGFILIPVRSVLAGDTERFLERVAKIQWGLMLCVYAVSHAPMLLSLEIPGDAGGPARLLFFFVLVVELSDVFQFAFGVTCGKNRIVPAVSPNKTVEGFIGGILTATAVGAGLWWITPFSIREAAAISFVLALVGFAGDVVVSAIKRDWGVKDSGTLLPGHGGILDRIDSLCFATPVFFHIVRYFYT